MFTPPPRRALIYRDFKQQEPRIAAIRSGDAALLQACESGDVYLGIARQLGFLRESMNAAEIAALRVLFKTVLLGIIYGLGARSLAKAPEEAELADALDKLGRPDAVTLSQVAERAAFDLAIWIRDRRNSRLIPRRMEACGYVAVQNPADKSDGRWRVNDKRQVIYGKADLTVLDRTLAAVKLAGARP